MSTVTFMGTTIASPPCIVRFTRGSLQPTVSTVPLVGGGSVVQKQAQSLTAEHEVEIDQVGTMTAFETFCATIEGLIGGTGTLYVSDVDTSFNACTLSRISPSTPQIIRTSVGGAKKYRATITLTFVQDRT